MNKLAGTSNLQYQFQRFGKEEFILVSIISRQYICIHHWHERYSLNLL